MKYLYSGPLSVEILDKKEVVLKNGEIYELNENLKRVQTLVNMKYLVKQKGANQKTTKATKATNTEK